MNTDKNTHCVFKKLYFTLKNKISLVSNTVTLPKTINATGRKKEVISADPNWSKPLLLLLKKIIRNKLASNTEQKNKQKSYLL